MPQAAEKPIKDELEITPPELPAAPPKDNIVAEADAERYSMYADPDFPQLQLNIDSTIMSLCQEVPFYTRISRYIRKIPTTKIPTAGVMINPMNDELCLLWNPQFVKSLTKAQLKGLLVHEYSHVIFLHLTLRHRKHSDWNIALDLAINSLITEMGHSNGGIELPEEGLVPARKMKPIPAVRWDKLTPKQQEQHKHFCQLIEGFPKLLASEHYFSLMQADRNKNPDKWPGEEDFVFVIGDGMDDHSHWSDMPDIKERITEKVRDLIQKAKQDADETSQGWGSIPQSVIDSIRAYTSQALDWRVLLAHFFGRLIRASQRSSFKRINRKCPWIHPGKTQKYAAKLLIAVDQSGSVDNEMLATFFNELDKHTKKIAFDYLPFDCEALQEDIKSYLKGMKFDFVRTRAGGTDFDAPTSVFNDPRNAGRWDGLLIMTDGQAPEPSLCNGQRAWVLGKNCEMHFPTGELVIVIDDNIKASGAWY